MPKVSPLILAAPEATSRICSTLCTLVPSRKAWWSQVVRLYRFRMWHMVESAVSSTEAAGTLHTAIPAKNGEKNTSCQMFLTFSHLTAIQEYDVYVYRFQHLFCTNTKFLTVMVDRMHDIIVDYHVQTYFFLFCYYHLLCLQTKANSKQTTETTKGKYWRCQVVYNTSLDKCVMCTLSSVFWIAKRKLPCSQQCG